MEKFPKDFYIVVLKPASGPGILTGFVYKQRNEADYLLPYIDNQGSSRNGLTGLRARDSESWREAQAHEATDYELAGKPVSVTDERSVDCSTEEQWRFLKKFYNHETKYANWSNMRRFVPLNRTSFTLHTDDVKGKTTLTFVQWLGETNQAGNWATRNSPSTTASAKEMLYIDCQTIEQWIFAKKHYGYRNPNKNCYLDGDTQVSLVGLGAASYKVSVIPEGTAQDFKDWLISVNKFSEWPSLNPGQTAVDPTQLLLDEANRRYPIGVAYYGLNSAKEPHKETSEASYEAKYSGPGIEVGQGWVYIEGTWAEVYQPAVAEAVPDTPKVSLKFKVGDWVILKKNPRNTPAYQVGEISGYYLRNEVGKSDVSYLADEMRIATTSEMYEIPTVAGKAPPVPETNLERAIREYPIGTLYYSLDSYGTVSKHTSTTTKHPRIYNHKAGDIEAGHGFLCYEGKWAEIYKPVEKVVDTLDPYKHLIGQTIPAGCLDAWCRQKDNWDGGYNWRTASICFHSDRTITEIKTVRDAPAFILSDSYVNIKLEGFEQFYRNYLNQEIGTELAKQPSYHNIPQINMNMATGKIMVPDLESAWINTREKPDRIDAVMGSSMMSADLIRPKGMGFYIPDAYNAFAIGIDPYGSPYHHESSVGRLNLNTTLKALPKQQALHKEPTVNKLQLTPPLKKSPRRIIKL